MRIAVIGAGGFIGARLSTAFEARGHDVFRFSSAGGCFHLESGMLADLAPVGALDALVYLSQSPYYRELPQRLQHVWNVNAVSAAKAAEWARQNGARRVVYASTGNIYEPSFEPHAEKDPVRRDDWYALSKLHGEETIALVRSVDVTFARLFGVYGPKQSLKLIPNLIESVQAGRSVVLQPHPSDAGDVDGLRLSLCYVDDAVRVLRRVVEAGGPRVLNVASPEVLSLRGIAAAIGRHLGVTPQFTRGMEPRACDLLAHTSLVRPILGEFTGFEDGLTRTIAAVPVRSPDMQEPKIS